MKKFWITAVLVLLLDRAAKLAAQGAMTLGERVVLLRGVLELRFTHNTGMALGFLAGHTAIGIILPLLAMTIGVLVLRRYRLSGFLLMAAGLIFGGFLGNFADRVLFGFVVDMVFFPWLPFFICNLADVAITGGAVLLGLSLVLRPGDWQEKPAGAKDNPSVNG